MSLADEACKHARCQAFSCELAARRNQNEARNTCSVLMTGCKPSSARVVLEALGCLIVTQDKSSAADLAARWWSVSLVVATARLVLCTKGRPPTHLQ